jgi:hypothetical protein
MDEVTVASHLLAMKTQDHDFSRTTPRKSTVRRESVFDKLASTTRRSSSYLKATPKPNNLAQKVNAQKERTTRASRSQVSYEP